MIDWEFLTPHIRKTPTEVGSIVMINNWVYILTSDNIFKYAQCSPHVGQPDKVEYTIEEYEAYRLLLELEK